MPHPPRNVRTGLYRRKRNMLPDGQLVEIGTGFVRNGDYMTLGPEYEEVELPLIDQLTGMGWTHLEGGPPGAPAPTDPKKSGRASFSEVILEGRLRAQLRVINKDNHGRPWLD